MREKSSLLSATSGGNHMSKKIVSIAMVLALACATAWAEPMASKTAPPTMAEAKAMMEKCAVCKAMAAHFDELAPSMKMDVVNLNDGVVLQHYVTDPTKVALFQSTCDEMAKNGEAAMAMSDEDAKTQLCPMCQSMRSAMKAGARMSMGKTKRGDLMVMTSEDAAVQAQLAGIGKQCAAMSSMKMAAK